MSKRSRTQFSQDDWMPHLTQSNYSQGYARRGTYRKPYVRKARSNTSGRNSVAWNLRRDNKTKPRVYGIPQQVKQAVKAIIDQQAEWKNTRGVSNGSCRGTIAVADVIQFMPGLAQGTSNGSRLGNEINIKSAKFDILIAPIGTGADNPPVKVRILIFRWADKGNRVFAAADAAVFYDNGGTSFAGTGAFGDQIAVPNPDLFEVLYDQITPIMQWVDTVPTTGTADSLTKIPMNQYRYSIDMPYACGKLKYNDNASTDPSKYMYMVLQSVNTNTLTSVAAAGTNTCEYIVQGTFEYLDA